MSNDEEFDEILEKLERRADHLKSDASDASIRDSHPPGRLPSVVVEGSVALPKPGDAIGENYQVEDIIGSGEDSTVLLVRHRGVDRLFAMKLLPQAQANDAGHVERFKEEARAASMIGHENIVFVTDFGKSNRFGFFYVMEYLNGESLADRLAREGHLSMEETLNVALCAASALSAVHELGIVHRDVRPTNLMSHQPKGSGDLTWKLLDFGLSTKVVEQAEALGLYDEPLYAAPELALGDGEGDGTLDGRADQFSLAAVVYHMLVGRPPWPDRTWTTATPGHWTRPTIAPEETNDVNVFLQNVLFQALAPRPEERFDDVETFVAKFQRSSGRSRSPTIPPIDSREAADAASQAASTNVSIGLTFDSEVSEGSIDEHVEMDDPPSLEISLDMLPDARPTIRITFQHADRLRREWRRNLVSGGLFVPTERRMAPDRRVIVSLEYGPTGASASFPGRVIEYTEDPGGLAIEVQPELRDELHQFLYELNLGLLDPASIVRPIRELTEDAELSANEAFLMSRLPEPTRVGRLRGMFASLPIYLEEIIDQLQEKGWVAVEGGRKRTRSRPGNPTPPTAMKGDATQRNEFVRLTLQRADYFRSQGNFLAEIETLMLAAQRYEEPEFHYRIGLSRIQFLNDVGGARAAMRQALELAPNSPKYRKALKELERL